jgi:type I restriction enzyme S subunit
MAMEEWKEYKLGDFMEFNPKIQLKKNMVARKITMDQLIPHSRDIYSWTYEPYSGGAKFQNGDTIMARITPCLENGKHAFISLLEENEIAYGSTEYIVMRGRKDISSNLFVYYLSHFHPFKYAAIKSMVGSSGRQRAQVDVLENLSLYLPPHSEQIRIANLLSMFDDKIENNRRINENLEQQAQALFKSWFVDFEPFRDQPFVESELGMIPDGWKVESIYKSIDVIYGAPYKSSLFNEKKEGMPLIRIRDLKTFKPQFYTPEILPNTEYINAGDVIAGMDAEFLPCIWIGETGILNQRCCKFKAKDKRISNYYIKYLVQPQLEFVQFYKTGTTVSHLGKSDIDKFKVISPPLEVIISFSEIVNPLLTELKRASKESRRLELLRDLLLPKLMSGEIKV